MIPNTRFYIQVKIHRISSLRFFQYLCDDLDDFTEDVYFMHEELVHELEAQYEVNKTMYEQIEIWNELFTEFQEFEVNFLLSSNEKRKVSFFCRKMQVILNDFIVVVTVH